MVALDTKAPAKWQEMGLRQFVYFSIATPACKRFAGANRWQTDFSDTGLAEDGNNQPAWSTKACRLANGGEKWSKREPILAISRSWKSGERLPERELGQINRRWGADGWTLSPEFPIKGNHGLGGVVRETMIGTPDIHGLLRWRHEELRSRLI